MIVFSNNKKNGVYMSQERLRDSPPNISLIWNSLTRKLSVLVTYKVENHSLASNLLTNWSLYLGGERPNVYIMILLMYWIKISAIFFLISKSCRNKSNEASGILGLFCVTAITKTVSFFAFLSFLLNNF